MGDETAAGRGETDGETRARRVDRRTLIRVGGMAATVGTVGRVARPSTGRAVAQATPSGEPVTVTDNGLPPENQPEQVEVYEQIVERYESANPNVTVESTANAWDPQTFPARLAAGELEDAFNVPYTEPQGIIARGQAADITEYLQAWPSFPSYNPNALQVVSDAEGRIYGIPIFGYALGLMYNRTFFEEAGLDPDSPPATWDDLRSAAKALTGDGRAGFAETSTDNQGGWHFTAWTYSAGGTLEEVDAEGGATAVFNSEEGVAALQLLKGMRFEDEAMTDRQLLNQDDTREMMATGQIAMCVQAPDSLPWIADRYPDVDMEQFGFGILPQNGGNATLAGGSVWMFNPNSEPEVIQAAVDWILFKEFDLENLDARLAADQERGALIGAPESPIFTGEYLEQRQEVFARYANAPTENYRAFIEGSATLELRGEPPVETQQLYAAIDPAVQAVLTDEGADPQELLDEAAEQFQSQVLDRL
ncbi:MAG: hypothetical protein AVDCRST_MAG49-2657 [uncultured Thermomicrobiales bacterium]|uniref:ABC transporter, substrate-binding protein (Cluster 1, maltose/g3p/polyamine/iron) n=1 Tax=uncultured Thermomicrobiales bacterium TaxID=1645740 RepID=A0A6J4UYG2_9BACT|nr:MAG: hypothetical protein AVDCRST_MAG49-2657 [uncultured Thermomicrobiales bacterium]